MNNILLLCRNIPEVKITLRINYDDQTLVRSDLNSVFISFPQEYREKISVDFQRVWQTVKANEKDNQERIELYKKCCDLGFAQSGIGANIFAIGKNSKCYADRFYHTEINYDGKIYRCTARGYTDEYVVGKMDDNGIIHWNEYEMVRRFGKAPFENEMCLKCEYLPLCLGPCSQKVAENTSGDFSSFCYLNSMEVRPETIIIDYYKQKMKALARKDEGEAR